MKEIIDLTSSTSSSSSSSSSASSNTRKRPKTKAKRKAKTKAKKRRVVAPLEPAVAPLEPVLALLEPAVAASVAPLEPVVAPVVEISYRPSVNSTLVSLNSRDSDDHHIIKTCNIDIFDAENIATVPLEIEVNRKCQPYTSQNVKRYLFTQLRKNKHVDMKKLKVPNQTTNNCWFNCFFMGLFISDGGRKFFHFFRSLMIRGELSNGDKIPDNIRNGFAIFNYCIESCLTGAPFVETMNTNVIVHYLYESMKHFPNIEIDYGLPSQSNYGNPTRYLETMINFLSLSSIKVKMFLNDADTQSFLLPFISYPGYTESVPIEAAQIRKYKLIDQRKPVHMIVLYYDKDNVRNKYTYLQINQYTYKLDSISCVAANSSGTHYSCLITLNGVQYHYDGSATREKIKKCNWKKWLNPIYAEDFQIEEEQTLFNLNSNHCFLYYYRVK